MNEIQTPTSGQEGRSQEIVAKRRLDEATSALDRGRRLIGVRQSEVRNLQGELGKSAEVGHAQADLLRQAAEERFREGLRAYLGQLLTVVGEAPDPPPPSLVAAGVLAGYDTDALYAALDAEIDAAADDPSTPVFIASTEAELEHRVAAKRGELRADEGRLEELEREHSQAEVDHREIVTSGGR